MEANRPNLNVDELTAYASAKHLAGVPDGEIQEDIVQMLKSDGWKDAAILPMINEVSRRTKGVAEIKGSPRSPPKVLQDPAAAMMAQLVQLLSPITARLEAIEQRSPQPSVPLHTPESRSDRETPPARAETHIRTKYPHPELFDGDRSKYSAFRYKAKAKLDNDYEGTSDKTKIAYIVSRCSERASDVILPWAEQNQEHCSVEDLWYFLNQQYDDPHLKAKALDQLSNLRQGKKSIRDYHMEFNRLELQSGIHVGDTQKKSMFSRGLHVEIQKALILVNEDLSFEQFAREATRVSDNLYRVSLATRNRRDFGSQEGHRHTTHHQKSARTPSPPERMDWEPTKVGRSGTRDFKPNPDQIECYACGKKGHVAKYCRRSTKSKGTKVSRAAQKELSSGCKCHPKNKDGDESDYSGKE